VSVRSVIACAAAALLVASACVRAQATCGAAGGPPSASVCDLADVAAGLPSPRPGTGAGNPVDVVTGNKYRREVDLSLTGPRAFVFARHYNSRNRHAGSLGTGWSHSFETRVAAPPGREHELQVIQGDGRRIVFTRASRDRWSVHWHAADPADGRLRTVAADYPHRVDPRYTVVWQVPDGRELAFDASGRLDQVKLDASSIHGALLDGPIRPGRPPAVAGWTAGGGRELRFEYVEHPAGPRLARLHASDPAPRGRTEVARFAYDALGQLAEVAWPDGTGRRYRYDDPNDPLLLTEVIATGPGPQRTIARHDYDPQGRPVRTTSEDGTLLAFDWRLPVAPGGIGTTTVTEDTGRVARYRWRYQRHRHEPRLLEAAGDACDACPPSPRRYDWDDRGRLRRLHAPGAVVSFEHAPDGLPVAAWRRGPGAVARSCCGARAGGASTASPGWRRSSSRRCRPDGCTGSSSRTAPTDR
jgi:YD repeat-containing protein